LTTFNNSKNLKTTFSKKPGGGAVSSPGQCPW